MRELLHSLPDRESIAPHAGILAIAVLSVLLVLALEAGHDTEFEGWRPIGPLPTPQIQQSPHLELSPDVPFAQPQK